MYNFVSNTSAITNINFHFFIHSLQNSAYELATQICSNQELKKELDASKFKKKIQTILRRPNRDEKVEEQKPCPISHEMLCLSELECPTTKDAIPMCICTGTHMVLNDWCVCPVSGLPAIYSKYKAYIESHSMAQQEDGKSVNDGDNDDDDDTNDRDASSSPSLKSFSCLDPVCGKRVSTSDLKKVSMKVYYEKGIFVSLKVF